MKGLPKPTGACLILVGVGAVGSSNPDARWIKLAFVIGLCVATLRLVIALNEALPILRRFSTFVSEVARSILGHLKQIRKRIYFVDKLRSTELFAENLREYGRLRTLFGYFRNQIIHPDTWVPILLLIALVPLTYWNATSHLFDYVVVPVGAVIVVYVRRAAVGIWMAIVLGLTMGCAMFGFTWNIVTYLPAFCAVGPIANHLAKHLGCKPAAGIPWQISEFAVVSMLAVATAGPILIGTATLLSFVTHQFCHQPTWLLELRMCYKCGSSLLLFSMLYYSLMVITTGKQVFTWKRVVEAEHVV